MAEAKLVETGMMERLELARIEIDTSIATAKQFPRNVGQIIDDSIAMATRSKDIAISMRYNLPVAGGQVGNSIRLAEILAANWGNMKLRSFTVDDQGDAIICRARAVDMQTNYEEEVEVRRSLLDKGGRRFKDHVVQSTVQAALKIAKRNVVFAVIPRSVVDEVADAALAFALDGAEGIDERRETALAYFKDLEVTQKEVLRFLERAAVDDINMADIQNLMGIASAIKNGDTTTDKTFRPKPKPNTAKVKPEDVKPKPAEPSPKASAPEEEAAAEEAEPTPLDDEGLRNLMVGMKIPKKMRKQLIEDVGMAHGIESAVVSDLNDKGRQLLESAIRDYKK